MRQQDASELFTFITGKLELPLLTMKVDLFHTGKEEANDDHKFVNERLLEIPIPPDPEDGSTITLEDCLELYFNNRVEVKRYRERRNTMSSTSKHQQRQQTEMKDDTNVEVVELSPSPSTSLPSSEINSSAANTTTTDTPLSSADGSNSSSAPSNVTSTTSNTDSCCADQQSSAEPPDSATVLSDANRKITKNPSKKRKHLLRSEVMMPALQVFSLLRKSFNTAIRHTWLGVIFANSIQ